MKRVTVNLSEGAYEKSKRIAKANKRSISAEIAVAVDAHLKPKKP